LFKAKAKINWKKSVMKIKNKDVKIQVPIEFRHITRISRVEAIFKGKTKEESSDESKSEDKSSSESDESIEYENE
ncbi:20191_t:CDS:1, partial [Racocetra persica]